MNVPITSSGPALSNYLTVLAVEVAGEVALYRRSTHAAHVAYLEAGAKLVDARGHARRGEWGPFLDACGIEARTARNMMALARAGLTADDVTEAGGVRGALDSLRATVDVAIDAADATLDDGEKPETVSGFDPNPDPAPLPPATPDRRELDPDADAPGEASAPTLYMRRRDRGECGECGVRVEADESRCPGCRARLAARRARRRNRARLGDALAPRLTEAARRGQGVRLTTAEVAALVGLEGDGAGFDEAAVPTPGREPTP